MFNHDLSLFGLISLVKSGGSLPSTNSLPKSARARMDQITTKAIIAKPMTIAVNVSACGNGSAYDSDIPKMAASCRFNRPLENKNKFTTTITPTDSFIQARDLKVDFIGDVDGHDTAKLISTLGSLKNEKGAKVILVTVKHKFGDKNGNCESSDRHGQKSKFDISDEQC